MKSLAFKPIMPGVKTLWVIKLKKIYSENSNRKPAIDFFIPMPPPHNEWMKAALDKNKAAVNVLGEIQAVCEKIKEDCNQPLRSAEDRLKKVEEVSGNLENLDDLIKKFNDLLKKIKPPPNENPS